MHKQDSRIYYNSLSSLWKKGLKLLEFNYPTAQTENIEDLLPKKSPYNVIDLDTQDDEILYIEDIVILTG